MVISTIGSRCDGNTATRIPLASLVLTGSGGVSGAGALPATFAGGVRAAAQRQEQGAASAPARVRAPGADLEGVSVRISGLPSGRRRRAVAGDAANRPADRSGQHPHHGAMSAASGCARRSGAATAGVRRFTFSSTAPTDALPVSIAARPMAPPTPAGVCQPNSDSTS